MDNRTMAHEGLTLLKNAVLKELEFGALSNADLVHRLDVPSDFEGKNRNYLSWSILGILVGEGKVAYRGSRQDRVYFLKSPAE